MHLISRLWDRPKSKAVQEGFAVWFDRLWADVECTDWAAWFLRRDGELHVADVLDNDVFLRCNGNYSYPVMGAFTGWLIDQYGMEKYLEFYRYRDYDAGMREVYGKSAGELADGFVEYMKGYELTVDVKERANERFRKRREMRDG